MVSKSRVVAAGLLVLLIAQSSSGQNPILRAAMREKLTSAQALLAAVVEADYAAIIRHADRLSWISENEIASWQTAAQPEYTKQASVFLLAVEGMREAGRTRDLEAATTEYATLVSSCVRCHSIVRNSVRASLAPLRTGARGH